MWMSMMLELAKSELRWMFGGILNELVTLRIKAYVLEWLDLE